MEHDEINNLLLSEDNESEVSKQLSKFVTKEVCLIRIMKINQLDLKHPC